MTFVMQGVGGSAYLKGYLFLMPIRGASLRFALSPLEEYM